MRLFLLAIACALASTSIARAECEEGDVGCDNDCYGEGGRDTCVTPPAACTQDLDNEPIEYLFEGADTEEREEISATQSTRVVCANVRVARTGYFAIWGDGGLADSCNEQRNETAYLTIRNSCTSEPHYPIAGNADDRYLIVDGDNEGSGCGAGGTCSEEGQICRDVPQQSQCCVASQPTYYGTFLLQASAPGTYANELCLHHWCPDYRDARGDARDLGFAHDECGDEDDIDSVHLRFPATFACAAREHTPPCPFGCGMEGACDPDPCTTRATPCSGAKPFCINGECVEDNPCPRLACEHGCVNGRCLYPRDVSGIDADGDGFPVLADCSDSDIAIQPGAPELCGDGIDQDCDGVFDESCEGAGGDAGVDASADAGIDGSAGDDDDDDDDDASAPAPQAPKGLEFTGGGACGVGSRSSISWSWLFAIALIAIRRYRAARLNASSSKR